MHGHQHPVFLDATWGDPSAWVANGLQWTHLPKMGKAIYRRLGGHVDIPAIQWFARHLVNANSVLPIHRVLVLGCGAGHVE